MIRYWRNYAIAIAVSLGVGSFLAALIFVLWLVTAVWK